MHIVIKTKLLGKTMCSISGFYNSKEDFSLKQTFYQPILDQLCQVLKHRGPDGSGTYLSKHCGFAHTRLSIIDIDRGAQPMTRVLDSHRFTIVYNGELYNTATLRDELTNKGACFQSHSDTEVILQGYIWEGPNFVKKLDGIFAFAIYDEEKKSLFLARDYFGVKPLFYTTLGDTFLFTSEEKGFYCHPDFSPVIDKQGLNEILSLGPARTPGSGILKNVYEVLPGEFLLLTPYGMAKKMYYKLPAYEHCDDEKRTIEKTRELVVGAIQKQMVSDVPICTFLSGGIDSSLVSSVCACEKKKQNECLPTYSFDFIDNDIYFKSNSFQPEQDRDYAKKMVTYLDSDHTVLWCDEQTQIDLLEQSVFAHDLPCMADIDSSLLHFCAQVAPHYKVVLTGECADEVFGGYPWFHREPFLSCNTFPWTPDLTPRTSLLQTDLLYELNPSDYVQRTYQNSLSECPRLEGESLNERKRREIAYLNLRYFMQTLLNRMDRTSMQAGLEARVPFADRALVEYIFNVPWSIKAKDGIEKNLLRQASEGLLPKEILHRKKSPYPKTYHPEYESGLVRKIKSILEGPSILKELLDERALNTFLGSVKDLGKPFYGQLMAGPQMIAYLIQIHTFFNHYQVKLEL